jgi:hypothetical protein
MNPALIALIEQEAPNVVALLRSAFAKKHPGQPQPTEEDVHAAYVAWRSGTLAKDDSFRTQG